MNATAEQTPIILSEFNSSEEQLVRNNHLFKTGALRFDLNKQNYFWTDAVNQNINNN